MVVEFVQAQDEQCADPPNDAAKAAEGPQFIGKSCRLNDALTFFETDQSQGKNADGGIAPFSLVKNVCAAKVTPRIFSPVLYCPYS